MVILGDVDPRHRPAAESSENLQNLADFVEERGGGLLMIAGERNMHRTTTRERRCRTCCRSTWWQEHQPAEPDGGLVESYRPELTPVGQMHPIFRFSPDEKENAEIWNGLKGMFWWSEGYQPKRAAEVLAAHPRLRRGGGQPRMAREGMSLEGHPLAVQQFVGAGRSLFFGFEETWRVALARGRAAFQSVLGANGALSGAEPDGSGGVAVR